MPKSSPIRTRRLAATAILTLFFIAVAGAAAIGWWYARESPPHQGPIVLVSVDGLSTSSLAAYGAAPADMPAIDALAADGVVFDRAYTHSPQILPAHVSLLTGQLPFEHGVRDDGGFALQDASRTLPELLRNRGFKTGAAVSSFLLRQDTGISQGFTFFDDELADPAAISRPGALTIDAAERWLRAQDDRRYFLMVQVDAGDADVAVARLVALLKDRGWFNTSTVVLVGDRGRSGTDAALDEGTLRVPLIVKQPDREGAGRRITAPVQHIDLIPTILDMVRAPVPEALRGRSLQRILEGGERRLTPAPIYSEWLAAYFRFDGHPVFALTVNDSRYVRSATEEIVRIPSLDEAPVRPDDVAEVSGLPAEGLPERQADEVPPLRATLDRLIGPDPIESPVWPPHAIRHRLALAGYLGGLRRLDVAQDVHTAEDPDQQRTIAEGHEEAARLAGARRYPAAIRALQLIVRSHPELASVHYQIGTLSMDMGRTAAAVAAFRADAALRPDAPEIPRALALALARAGDAEAAHEQAAIGIELAQPGGPAELGVAYRTAASVALILGEQESALAFAQSAQTADPSLPMHALVEGRLHVDAGRHADAVDLLENAVRVTRQHGSSLEGLHACLADALAGLGRSVEAEASYREEISAFPQSIGAYVGLATLSPAPERMAAAEAVIDALLAEVPTPDGYAAAVRALTDLGLRRRADALRSEARTRFRGDQAPVVLAREQSR